MLGEANSDTSPCDGVEESRWSQCLSNGSLGSVELSCRKTLLYRGRYLLSEKRQDKQEHEVKSWE